MAFKALWSFTALGNVMFFALREFFFGPVTFQGNMHTILITPLDKWDEEKQVLRLDLKILLPLLAISIFVCISVATVRRKMFEQSSKFKNPFKNVNLSLVV